LLCALREAAMKNVSASNDTTLRSMDATSGTEAHCNAKSRREDH
jgi:hypothetical protein